MSLESQVKDCGSVSNAYFLLNLASDGRTCMHSAAQRNCVAKNCWPGVSVLTALTDEPYAAGFGKLVRLTSETENDVGWLLKSPSTPQSSKPGVWYLQLKAKALCTFSRSELVNCPTDTEREKLGAGTSRVHTHY